MAKKKKKRRVSFNRDVVIRPRIVRKHRTVTLQVEIFIPNTETAEEAEELALSALQVDCWLGNVEAISTLRVEET